MADVYYVNVFCDREGGLHYSTEEFSIHQNRIAESGAALDDAYRFSVAGDWRYICTLSNNEALTDEIFYRLKELGMIKFALEETGKTLRNCGIEELFSQMAERE